jgi:hypothetical protein
MSQKKIYDTAAIIDCSTNFFAIWTLYEFILSRMTFSTAIAAACLAASSVTAFTNDILFLIFSLFYPAGNTFISIYM